MQNTWQHFWCYCCSCPWCWAAQTLTLHITVLYGRIWPFNDSPRVFPNDVVLCEYEERPVDGEAVLPVGDGVVQSHGPGPLRLGLFHGSSQPRRRRVLSIPTLLQVPIPGVHRAGSGLVSKPSHSTKRWRLLECFTTGESGAKGDSRRKKTTKKGGIHLQSTDSFSSAKNSPQKLQIPITPYPREKKTDYIIQLAYILRRIIHLLNDRCTRCKPSASLLSHLFKSALQSALNNFLRVRVSKLRQQQQQQQRRGEERREEKKKKDPLSLYLAVFYQHPSSFWSDKAAPAWSKTTLCSLDGEIRGESSQTLRILTQ